jgi:hypothetical protein
MKYVITDEDLESELCIGDRRLVYGESAIAVCG